MTLIHHHFMRTALTVGVAAGVALVVAPVDARQTAGQASEQTAPAPHDRTGMQMPERQDVSSLPTAVMATTSQIAATPSAYYGRTVIVDGHVADALHAHYFTLDEDAWFMGPDVGVIVADPVDETMLRDGEDVLVTGSVRAITTTELERDFNWFDADELEIDAETHPIIFAESIRTRDGRELTANATTPHLIATTAGRIAERPATFYGHHVEVRAEVEDVFSDGAFTLDEDQVFAGPDVLVLHNTNTPIVEDTAVTVKGQVHPYDERRLERDIDWFDIAMFGDRETDEGGWGFDRHALIVAQQIVQ